MKRHTVFIFLFFLCACKQKILNGPTAVEIAASKVRSFVFINVDSVKYYKDRLHQVANKDIPGEKALVHYGDGFYFLNLGLHNKALENFNQATPVFEKEKKDSLLSYTYVGIGNCHKLSGNAEEAIRNYLKAIPGVETSSNKKMFTICYGNLAETYQQKGDAANAKKYLLLAQANEAYGSRNYVAMKHLEANLYGMNGDIDSALLTDYEGIALAEKNNFPEKLTSFYDNIAQCFLVKKNYDSAAYYFQKCIYLDSIQGRVQLMADTYSQMVNVYGYKNDPERMMSTARHANKLCDSTQYLRGKYRIYEGLNNYYSGTQNWERLAEVKDSMQQIYKRLINEETEARIAEYNVEYETSKKEQLIATQQNTLQQSRYLTVFLSIIALLLLISIGALYRNYRTRKQIAVNLAIQQQKDSNVQAVFESEQTERIRIARDLHDSIGQKLSVLKMYLNNRENDALKTPALLDETISEVRNISHNLLPEELNFGFISTLKSDVEKIKDANAFAIHLEMEDAPYGKLSMLASLNVVRVFREILTNMVKHSKATNVHIRVFIEGDSLHLQITDDGIGIDSKAIAQSQGIGWKNILARINMLRGKISIDNKEPGSQVKIEIPLSQ